MTRTKTVYSAKRVLDIASLLVLTTCYAIQFAGFQWLMFDTTAIIFLTTLFTCTAILQALMDGSISPRITSVLVGCVFGIVFAFAMLKRYLRRFGIWQWTLAYLPCDYAWFLVATGSILGLGIGYITGTCVGGVFLVSDMVRQKLQPIEPLELDDFCELPERHQRI